MPTRNTSKRKSGGAQLKAAGKRAIMLGLPPAQYEVIAAGAAAELRPVAQFVTYHALQAAAAIVAAAAASTSPAASSQ